MSSRYYNSDTKRKWFYFFKKPNLKVKNKFISSNYRIIEFGDNIVSNEYDKLLNGKFEIIQIAFDNCYIPQFGTLDLIYVNSEYKIVFLTPLQEYLDFILALDWLNADYNEVCPNDSIRHLRIYNYLENIQFRSLLPRNKN